ncbi:MAG: hypothetical protein Q9166_003579 [cf. Caloplaca sp. 2 TL-2023]
MADVETTRGNDTASSSTSKRGLQSRLGLGNPYLLPSVRGSPYQHEDPELGNMQSPMTAVSTGYSSLAPFLDSDDGFMLYRRFGFLHQRVLLYRQDELRRMEQDLEELDQRDDFLGLGSRQSQAFEELDWRQRGRQTIFRDIERKLSEYSEYIHFSGSRQSQAFEEHVSRQRVSRQRDRQTIFREIERNFSEYNSMILTTKAFEHAIPNNSEYRNVKQYLERGHYIYMDYTDTQSDFRQRSWKEYENAVKDFLQGPTGAAFLERPLDQDLMEAPRRRKQKNRACTSVVKNIIDLLVGATMGIVFWITHITAALGFVLLANLASSGSDDITK